MLVYMFTCINTMAPVFPAGWLLLCHCVYTSKHIDLHVIRSADYSQGGDGHRNRQPRRHRAKGDMETTHSQTTPRVSVIIPCYNTAQLVAQCLDSVFAQTFRDFEALLVND